MIRALRITATVLTALVLLVLGATPASAHTVSGQGSTDFKTVIASVTPALPGLTVKSVELGSQVELTWRGAEDLIVLGYQGEPYLRVGPAGVFRNRLAPDTYLNATRFGSTATITIPADVDATKPPQWVRLSGGRTVLWHDHRTHWMGGILPLAVRQHPGQPHTVFPWTFDLATGGTKVTVRGALLWVPSVSPLPWIALIVVLAVLGVVAGRSRWWAQALLTVTALIVAADVVHAVGTGLDFAGSTGHRVLLIIGGSYYSVVAWVLGAVAVRLLAKRSVDGLFAAVFTGLVIGLFGGLADVASLAHSQIPFALAPAVARLLVAVSVGGALGLIAGSIIAFRRNRPDVAGTPSDADAEAATAPRSRGLLGPVPEPGPSGAGG